MRMNIADVSSFYEPLITSEQAAVLLGGIHIKTVQRMARTGILPAYCICDKWFFRSSELDKWLATRLNTASQSVR